MVRILSAHMNTKVAAQASALAASQAPCGRGAPRSPPSLTDYLVAAIDVVGLPAAIACFIWFGSRLPAYASLVLPLWLVTSFVLHRDTLATLGLRLDNLGPATHNAAIAFAIAVVGLLAIGLVLHRPWSLPPNFASPLDLLGYMGSCIAQQLALNSLVMNRLLRIVSRTWVAAIVAGVIFSTLHLPNPVLVPCTLVAGTAMAWLFAANRSILPLVVAHALLGTLVAWAFPVSWQHQLRVGPAYYETNWSTADLPNAYWCQSCDELGCKCRLDNTRAHGSRSSGSFSVSPS
jgi:membrane protease YdiL (CAAX protease family)